jgi:hypothetical protein
MAITIGRRDRDLGWRQEAGLGGRAPLTELVEVIEESEYGIGIALVRYRDIPESAELDMST